MNSNRYISAEKTQEYTVEFDSNKWKKLVSKMKKYVAMDEAALEQQVVIMGKQVGNVAYEIISELCAPERPEDMRFDEVARLLGTYIEGKASAGQSDKSHKNDYKMALKEAYKRAQGAWRERASGFRARAAAAAEAVAARARALRRVRLSCFKSEPQKYVREPRGAAVLVVVAPDERYFSEGDSTAWMAEFRGNLVVLVHDLIRLEFQVDAANKTSGISKECYAEFFTTIPIERHDGTPEAPEFIQVKIEWGSTTVAVQLFLHDNSDRPLVLGRDWMESQVCSEYPEVFSDSSVLGECSHRIGLQLKDTTPMYREARTLPPPLQECVANELHRLERERTIYKLEKFEYGTPIIPILKKNGEVIICAEYNTTINTKIQEINYRVPKVALVCAALHEGQHFTRLDLSDAYRHMLLEEEAQRYTAISTHLGTYAYRRVPFGLKGTLGSMQVILERILKGLKFAIVLDDIWVTGRHWAEHLTNLRAVLDKLKEGGFRINRVKCDFFGDSLRYVGYGMNKSGLYVDQSRLNAITNAPQPKSVNDLKSFLGLVNYYKKFCLDCYCILKPLYSLLDEEKDWKWSDDCEKAFIKIKAVLTSFLVSAIFVEDLPLVLAVASGPDGVGAVLSHVDGNGNERPIACASRTLSDSEAARCHLDNGVLAVAFGVEMHRQYLYGHRFVLRTDQREVSEIFSGEEGIPSTLAGCLQWSVAGMADYEFEVEYAPADMNESAVALSRLPLPAPGTPYEDSYLQFVVDNDESRSDKSHCVLLCC